jgi:sugar lactone lactonase YvrE
MNIRAISDVVSDLGEGPIWSPQTNCVTWTDITQNKYHTADLEYWCNSEFFSSINGRSHCTHTWW